MRAAVYLAQTTGHLSAEDSVGDPRHACASTAPFRRSTASPPTICCARLVHDKKTVQGKVHFVLPVRIGEVAVVSGVDESLVLAAIRSALA